MKRVVKSKHDVQKIVGEQCREFRVSYMGYSLEKMSDRTGINLKTLSNFENGRSSNLHLFYVYLTFLDDVNISKLIDTIINKSEVI